MTIARLADHFLCYCPSSEFEPSSLSECAQVEERPVLTGCDLRRQEAEDLVELFVIRCPSSCVLAALPDSHLEPVT